MNIVYPSKNINVPAILDTNGVIAAANTARIGLFVQNVGQSAVKLAFGTTASDTVYHVVLKGGTADGDGLGGSISLMQGVIPTGVVTMYAASNPKVVVMEIAP